MELIDTAEWCEACHEEPVEKLLMGSAGKIIGWYCDPCGAIVMARTMERITEHTTRRNQYRARCHFNETSNRQCLLDDQHSGGHNLPCNQSSAHQPHVKASVDVDGTLYQCGGQQFDNTLIRKTLDRGPCWFRNSFGEITIYNFQRCADDPDCQRCKALDTTRGT